MEDEHKPATEWTMWLLCTVAACTVQCSGAIVFQEQPMNVTVYVGGSAFFPCTYTGTSTLPLWRIGGIVYDRLSIPPRHSFSSSGLTIHDCKIADNGVSYMCFFEVISRSLALSEVQSDAGFLHVVQYPDQGNTATTLSIPETAELSNKPDSLVTDMSTLSTTKLKGEAMSTSYFTTCLTVHKTTVQYYTQAMQLTSPFPASTRAFSTEPTVTPYNRDSNTELTLCKTAFAVGAAVVVTVILVTVTLMLLCYKSSCRQLKVQPTTNQEAAVYDEVMTEHVVELKHNVAYEKHKPVRMTRNICYTSPRYQMPQEEDAHIYEQLDVNETGTTSIN